ncbi:hypothetical protein HBI56_173100 [Parastagonospora nodorum]|uniref:Uncharacterized protein n=1 Tax=Phaeosphaeria nodorum (strain SN15 / ATCC MYA-4574 / FGSC 10173) TaxID=321614 RepID=A0A7U2HZ32_PHANO|nr:hypothetical protein HBH56_221920 [Parastagonospora nodorum]QRC97200.1 hypothetical protein JI435_410270 [Parastagonospora nodorum SN15]KAH3924172.1 hypothetical protein HBH54_199840 [Parastagonospora nodorum]KAH3964787.1 hypothetical protein HBH52_209530 [Parastagonospora nodorum]KAH3995148.1 hypothetical protein HBI10_177060 [Parastagonospora nodorum]
MNDHILIICCPQAAFSRPLLLTQPWLTMSGTVKTSRINAPKDSKYSRMIRSPCCRFLFPHFSSISHYYSHHTPKLCH